MTVLLFIHIISAVIFIGNIVTAAFWKVKAELSKNETTINHAVKNVMIADYVFTIPSIMGLLISGLLLSYNNNYSLTELNWLTLSLALFIITGVIWLLLLLPLQRKMINYSAKQAGLIHFKKVSRTWDVIGTIAVIIPIIILYLMVAKPF